jgi:hypothetical protein
MFENNFFLYRSNQVRFRIRFDEEEYLIGISELYIGSNCINACNDHGMCSNNGRCRLKSSSNQRLIYQIKLFLDVIQVGQIIIVIYQLFIFQMK